MNILIIGLGSIANKHIKAINSVLNDAKIYALRSSINADEIEGVINLFDINEINFKLDFVIISNPTNLHYAWINKLAEKGFPLFIEKPVIHSLIGSELLVDKIKRNNVLTYVACNLRFHPCLQFLKNEIIKRGTSSINEINVYCGSYLPDWRPGKNFREIYSANKEMGGGVHLDLFHELDYTSWIFGYPKQAISFLKSSSSLNISAFDYANYIFEYENFSANIVLNYYRRKPKRSIEIVFESETITIDLIQNKITNDNGIVLFEAKEFEVIHTYVDQIAYFANCLKTKEMPMNSLEESLNVLKICLNNER